MEQPPERLISIWSRKHRYAVNVGPEAELRRRRELYFPKRRLLGCPVWQLNTPSSTIPVADSGVHNIFAGRLTQPELQRQPCKQKVNSKVSKHHERVTYKLMNVTKGEFMQQTNGNFENSTTENHREMRMDTVSMKQNTVFKNPRLEKRKCLPNKNLNR